MNGISDFARARVPMVGQQIKICGWFPTVSVQCQCEPAKPVLLIVGEAAIVECPSCRRSYGIGTLSFDATTQKGRIEIIQVLVGRADDQKAAS